MNRLYVLLFLFLILSSGCRKSANNPAWERSFGRGKAMFIKATADSGLIACGELGGKPYIIKLDRNKNKVSDYTYDNSGLFSSAWTDRDLSVAVGSSGGKMLITCLDNQNKPKWDTTFGTTNNIDYSIVTYLGNGNLLAIGSASPDSVNSFITGLYCVWFDTTGSIISKKEIKESSFFSANRAVTDNSGNLYLALTRKNAGSKSKATVAKFTSQLQRIWETELYNNPNFGASTLGITLDNSGNVYVSGKTELPVVDKNPVDNSFTVSLTGSGTIRWKKYLESTNVGSSVILDGDGRVLMLNHNCFIINGLNPLDGSATGIIRPFNVCESKNTDTFGWDLDINYDQNLIFAGSNGGGFYIGTKSPLF
jgi:hypothetical protein